MNPIARIIKFVLVETPIYPHWLDFRNLNRANLELYREMRGDCLETGCGNGEVKRFVLKHYGHKVKSYLATDYSSWDDIFDIQSSKINRLGSLTKILYGEGKVREKVDQVCDALNLPFKNESFDTYASFEVLEHINYPDQFFAEASRVLRRGGKVLISVPFIYREHSEGTGYDFHRFTISALKKLCEDHGLLAKRVFTYSYYGTAMAALTNQYVVRKIAEGNTLVKVVFFLVCPLIFLYTNIVGFIIDSIDHDERFSSHYHLIAVKK